MILHAIKKGDLDTVAKVLREEPEVEDENDLEKILENKNNFLINEIGDEG